MRLASYCLFDRNHLMQTYLPLFERFRIRLLPMHHLINIQSFSRTCNELKWDCRCSIIRDVDFLYPIEGMEMLLLVHGIFYKLQLLPRQWLYRLKREGIVFFLQEGTGRELAIYAVKSEPTFRTFYILKKVKEILKVENLANVEVLQNFVALVTNKFVF